MAYKSYKEIGYELAINWGYKGDANIKSLIGNLKNDERTQCLLAAVVMQLDELNNRIRRFGSANVPKSPGNNRSPVATEGANPVADGMLQWMRRATGDLPINELDLSNLSRRSRKVLVRAEIHTISQITAGNLEGIRQCGVTTLAELLAWAAKYTPRTE